MDSGSFIPVCENIQISEYKDIYFESIKDVKSYVPLHWHDSLELIYLKSGYLTVSSGTGQIELKPGDYILIEPWHFHSTTNTLGNTSILMQIPVSFLQRYFPKCPRRCFILPDRKDQPNAYRRVVALLKDMEQYNYTVTSDESLKFQALLFELLYYLYHNFGTGQETDNLPGSKYKQRLMCITAYAKENYSRSLTIREAAGVVSLQPEYFCRFFKKHMGMTFLQYVNEIRLSHIYNDLIYTNTPVNQLLEIHGFTNYHLFRRMFRERFKGTPGEVRKKRIPV